MTDLFAFPQFLWFFLYGGILALAALRWLPRKRNRLLARLIASHTLRSLLASGRGLDLRGSKAWLLTAALFFSVLALAGPQWGARLEKTPLLGNNLIIVMDVSDSMLAQDIKPSRFERAKFEIISAYAKSSAQALARLGLVTFAGRAYLQCPLTLDAGALRLAFETVAPGSLPHPGTNIAAGLKTAQNLLSKVAGARDVLLVTDGENHEGDARSMTGPLLKNRIRVSTLWVGSPEGEPIPLKDENGNFLGYKKNREDKTVLTRAKADSVEELTAKTGGRFIRLDNSADPQAELGSIVNNPDSKKDKGIRTRLQNRFQIPLAVGFMLLLAEMAIPEKKRK